ncbi:MAG: hypothetical protein J4F36_07835 [Nitrosopumilaceae archaeon]|nr:hypothetical protein [Nitrosopumilaceae archaeon]
MKYFIPLTLGSVVIIAIIFAISPTDIGQTTHANNRVACDVNDEIPMWDGLKWVCTPYALPTNVPLDFTLVSTNLNGQRISIAIGSDGNPVISYGFSSLEVAACGNTTCTAGNTSTILDGAGAVGRWISIAIGSDDNPIISYHDNTNGDLKIYLVGTPIVLQLP